MPARLLASLPLLAAGLLACASGSPTSRAATTPAPSERATALDGTRQLIVVTTPGWDSVSGTLRRYERGADGGAWIPVGDVVPVAVGHAGLAWGSDALRRSANEPRKHEGDGRAPAGMFPLDTVFGFAAERDAPAVQLPYVQLTSGSECVDDVASVHYNTVVDRARAVPVDWTSSERMRQIGQYRLGVIVGYNAPAPERGRGSCIFLHIWSGPGVGTAGCTAFPASAVETVVRWLDPSRRPMLVQLPSAEYARLRTAWRLP
jgi:D-alanyl-D-alanine dipeptidase